MSVHEIADLLRFKDGVGTIFSILFVASFLVQIAPIKLNPWDKLLKWAGDRINHNVNEKIDKLEKKLDDHISAETTRRVDDIRNNILIFANECSRGIVHSKEQYRYIIAKCDDYETYIEENHLKNGVISEATKLIKETYQNRLKHDDFLKGETENA